MNTDNLDMEARLRESLRAVADSTTIPAVPIPVHSATLTPGTATSLTDARRSRRRTVPLALAATAAVLATAAAGWTVLGPLQGAADVGCRFMDSGYDSYYAINAITGDPVTDCETTWQRAYGTTPPPLTAYDNGNGNVIVQPSDREPDRGWKRLRANDRLDSRQIELEAALDDWVDGLASRCFDQAAGERHVAERLAQLGLTGWSVTTERRDAGQADGQSVCATFLMREPAKRNVVLITERRTPQDPPTPLAALAERLRTQPPSCQNTREAADAVRAAATDVGLADEALVVEQVADNSSPCARLTMTVGGTVQVVIRGGQGT